MNDPVLTKSRMYDLLIKGAFGNTIPQWFSLKKWLTDPEARRYSVWGIRTFTPGGPCCLYCPDAEVEKTVREYESKGHACSIGIMIDAIVDVTMFADVYDTPQGLIVYCVERPGRGGSWRKLMPTMGKQYEGLAARMMLRKHLNASSLADLEAVLENYPEHVVELSACEQCIGTVPGRNAVVWECRRY